jgi:hypothetical protein
VAATRPREVELPDERFEDDAAEHRNA